MHELWLSGGLNAFVWRERTLPHVAICRICSRPQQEYATKKIKKIKSIAPFISYGQAVVPSRMISLAITGPAYWT